MTTRARRRRAFLMLSLALACGGLAASEVGDRVREVERRVGSQVPVLVAARDLPADAELKADDLALREMPERYVPPGALASATEVVAAQTAVAVAAGTPITQGLLGAGDARGARSPGALRRGERAVEVAVVGGEALAEAAPGSRVDVLISTEPGEGPGRSFLALQDVELLDLRATDAGEAEGASPRSGEDAGSVDPTGTATLRVTLRQAVYLTAAQNFAREVRLLSRPARDSRRAGRAAVGAADL